MAGQKTEAAVPQGAESRPEGWLPPLPAGEELSCFHGQPWCQHQSRPLFLASWPTKSGLEPEPRASVAEAGGLWAQSPGGPTPLPIPAPSQTPQCQASLITKRTALGSPWTSQGSAQNTSSVLPCPSHGDGMRLRPAGGWERSCVAGCVWESPDAQVGELGWLPSAPDLPVLCFPEWPLCGKHSTQVISWDPHPKPRREH